MSEIAIRISDLSKSYSLNHEKGRRSTNLAEGLIDFVRNPFSRSSSECFWALRDIDLDIREGVVVGVIGRNGAGKSTLLKILSRITEPTTGRVELYGRVGSLLEVGTGFHPELSGRENIFLNGAILGMRRPEIKKQFDAIVDFAGVDKFLDTPVKRYSSGMYVRLAFAVAAHLNPEILIVDEVLAVGDAEFQKKCMGKMKDVSNSGRTVLFVSHNMAAIKSMCSRAVLLANGTLCKFSQVDDVVETYLQFGLSKNVKTRRAVPINKPKWIKSIVPVQNPFVGRGAIAFDVSLGSGADTCWTHLALHIYNRDGDNVVTLSTEHLATGMLSPDSTDIRLLLTSPHLIPGNYTIDANLYAYGIIDHWPSVVDFEVVEPDASERYSTTSATGAKYCYADFELESRS